MSGQNEVTGLLAAQQVERARNETITRIEAVMMLGAVAMHRARATSDPFLLEREVETHGVRLIWRDGGKSSSLGVALGPAVQVCAKDACTPADFAAAFALAERVTQEILTEHEHKLAVLLAHATSQIAAYESVGKGWSK